MEDADGAHKAEAIGVHPAFHCTRMHQAAHHIVREQESIKFLDDAQRGLAAQGVLGQIQVRFEFIECVFDFPPFMIEGGQLLRRIGLVIEQGRNEAVDDSRRLRIIDGVFNIADLEGGALALASPVLGGGAQPATSHPGGAEFCGPES